MMRILFIFKIPAIPAFQQRVLPPHRDRRRGRHRGRHRDRGRHRSISSILKYCFFGMVLAVPVWRQMKTLFSFSIYYGYDALSSLQQQRHDNFDDSAPTVVVDKMKMKMKSSMETTKRNNDEGENTVISFRDRITDYFENLQLQEKHDYNKTDIAWIQEYLYWHDEMLQKFPGDSLLSDDSPFASNPDVPKVLISILDEATARHHGLTDRVQDIGHLLRFCYEERRVLFYVWMPLLSLESYLVPNLFNWTLPTISSSTSSRRPVFNYLITKEEPSSSSPLPMDSVNAAAARTKDERIQIIQNTKHIWGSYLHPFNVIWDAYFQPSERVQQQIDKVVMPKKRGLKTTALSSQNDDDNNSNPSSSSLLISGQYDAVHVRIGHPAFENKKKYTQKAKEIDVYGDKCNNTMGEKFSTLCMNSAARAIACAKWLGGNKQKNPKKIEHDNDNNHNDNNDETSILPLYIFADSPELVRTILDLKHYYSQTTTTTTTNDQLSPNNYMVVAEHSSKSNTQPQGHPERFEAWLRLTNTTADYPSRIVGRKGINTAHIAGVTGALKNTTSSTSTIQNTDGDKEEDIQFSSFASTFVDLYIASQARCINVGVGRYAYLAAKIGGTTCWVSHAKNKDSVVAVWGMNKVKAEVPPCPYVFKNKK